MQEKKRAEVYFSGMVQGVGFRFTTIHLARGFCVSGYVRNLPDGKVEVIAEGTKPEIKAFIAAIRQSSLQDYIDKVDIRWQEYLGESLGFDIKY